MQKQKTSSTSSSDKKDKNLKNTKTAIIGIVIVIFIIVAGSAYYRYNSSELGLFGYPDFESKCSKQKTAAENILYVECLKNYSNTALQDIRTIQENLSAANFEMAQVASEALSKVETLNTPAAEIRTSNK